jgi:indole-3-glycerol phosphate synthase
MNSTPTILKKIIARKYEEVAEREKQVPLETLLTQAKSAGPVRGFATRLRAIAAQGMPAVIAEIKKASPSQGVIRADFVPADIAQSYARAGAACLSVLTDRDFFLGDDRYLIEARDACALPVIRKDFMVSIYQIAEARALGADCVLLIVAALTDSQLRDLHQAALELGLDVLVEVHDAAELARTLALGSRLIGINNRNLHTFETQLDTTYQLAPTIPAECFVVTESGLHTREQVDLMRAQGIQGFLVGEAFMRKRDPGSALRDLFF